MSLTAELLKLLIKSKSKVHICSITHKHLFQDPKNHTSPLTESVHQKERWENYSQSEQILLANAKDGRVHLWSLHIGIALASKEADGRLAASLHSPFFSWWMNTTNGPLAAPTPHLHPSLGIKGTMLACCCKVEKKRWLGKGETGRGRGSCQLLGEGAIHGRRWNESENEFCSPLHLLVSFHLC